MTRAMTVPTLRPTEMAAWVSFIRAHADLMRELDSELDGAHRMSLSDYEVLFSLARAPERRMRMSDLAEAALLTRSGITRVVERLERAGLVERASCPSDLRGTNAILTDEGMRRVREANETHLAGVRARFVDRYSEDELGVLIALLARLLPDSDDHGDCSLSDGE